MKIYIVIGRVGNKKLKCTVLAEGILKAKELIKERYPNFKYVSSQVYIGDEVKSVLLHTDIYESIFE